MTLRHLLLVSLLTFVFGCSEDEAKQTIDSVSFGEYQPIKAMEGATTIPRSHTFTLSIDAPLFASLVEPFIVDHDAQTLIPLEAFKPNRSQKLIFDFKSNIPLPATLVFKLSKVGYPHNFNHPAQLLCTAQIDSIFDAKMLTCNFSTTSLYLFASSSFYDESPYQLSYPKVVRWLQYQEHFDNTTLQYLTATLNLLMSYVTYHPDFLPSQFQNDGFLSFFAAITSDFLSQISSKHYFDIRSFERVLTNRSPSFTDISMKIMRDIEALSPSSLEGVPKIRNFDFFLTDFLKGNLDVSLHSKEVFRVADIQFDSTTRTLSWFSWPWFKEVMIRADDEPFIAYKQNHASFADTPKTITLLPMGLAGKFQVNHFTPLVDEDTEEQEVHSD